MMTNLRTGDEQAAPSSAKDVETRKRFWEIRDMKGYGRYWRVTNKGNTGICRGTGNKGKN